MTRQFLERSLRRAVDPTAGESLDEWRQWFAEFYDDWRCHGRTPDGAFARVDRARLEASLHDRIAGPRGLAQFVRERAAMQFCGPVLLGESVTPIGARQSFPALALPDRVRLVGSEAFAWRSAEALDVLVLTSSGDKKVPDDALSVPMLEPLLVYLALLAGTEEQPNGESSAAWLGEREFRLHVAHEGGIASFSYQAGDISPEQARAYLAERVGELLDGDADAAGDRRLGQRDEQAEQQQRQREPHLAEYTERL
jgi:hypothetical protein